MTSYRRSGAIVAVMLLLLAAAIDVGTFILMGGMGGLFIFPSTIPYAGVQIIGALSIIAAPLLLSRARQRAGWWCAVLVVVLSIAVAGSTHLGAMWIGRWDLLELLSLRSFLSLQLGFRVAAVLVLLLSRTSVSPNP